MLPESVGWQRTTTCGKSPIDTLVKPPIDNQEVLMWQALQEDSVAAELAALQLRNRC